MNKKILGLTLAMGGLVFAGASQAVVIIDDFSDGFNYIVDSPGSETTTLTASDFATDRTISITDNGGIGGANFIVNGGELIINTGYGTTSEAVVDYANAGGYDFTQAETSGAGVFEKFFLKVVFIDQGGVDVTLSVNGVSSTKTGVSGSNIELYYDFSEFAGADLTNVTSITYQIHNNAAVDAVFDSFGAYGTQQAAPPVPEPTALALLGLGLAGFGFGRRKAAK